MSIVVILGVGPCDLAGYQCLGGTYRLHRLGDMPQSVDIVQHNII